MRFFRLFFFFAFCVSFARAEARRFELERDTLAFANDTVFAYGIDEQGNLQISLRKNKPQFSHGCFLMVRATLQFWKFARFDKKLPKLSREEYAVLVKKLFRIPAWLPPAIHPTVIPGFADLREFSKAYEGLIKEDIGNWFATYLRPGNYRLMFGHPRSGQVYVARKILEDLRANVPPALYISKFPKMNHAIIVLSALEQPNGDILFKIYDANYPSEPSNLTFNKARSSFDFERRWYWPGGQVNAMRIYVSPVQ